MKIILTMVILLLAVNAYALPSNCYIYAVGEPVLREGTIYYPVRRVCYNPNGGRYRIQESDYTVDEINAENYEPGPPEPPNDP